MSERELKSGKRVLTYRKDDWNATPYRLAPIQLGRIAQPQVLRAIGALPAYDGRAKQQDLDALTCWQLGDDTGVMNVDNRLWPLL